MKDTKMKKRWWKMVLLILLSILALIVIWFLIPYSPLKTQFKKDIRSLQKETIYEKNDLFTKDEFAGLPEPLLHDFLVFPQQPEYSPVEFFVGYLP